MNVKFTLSILHRTQNGFSSLPASLSMCTGDSIMRVTHPGPSAGHLPETTPEVKNVWACTSTPPYAFMAWFLIRHRDRTINII
jgi:hypothetical protein